LVPKAASLYITFDIDVMDPSQAPAPGRPRPADFFYDVVRACIQELVGNSNLVAFDLVEVALPYDSSELTVQVAARLIVDILSARVFVNDW